MEKDQLSRKLAAILHADVVGSALLVQKNETLVAEFDRASDAVPGDRAVGYGTAHRGVALP